MAFFDTGEECLEPADLSRLQRRKLSKLLDCIAKGTSVPTRPTFYQRKLADLAFDPTRDPVDVLPFTSRAEIQEDQQFFQPYGSNFTLELSKFTRFHQTSGTSGVPVRWLDTPESWEWVKRCWSVVFRGAGLRDGDRLMFPFSFGPFLGFWAAFEAGCSLGNMCFPAGGMTTAARLGYLIENEITAVCCTPTYALHMAEVAGTSGVSLAESSVRMLIVAGEPGGNIPTVRARIEEAWGARVIDHSGMTEIGPWGFECEENPGGLHVIESEFIAEVIDPASGAVVPDGTRGELVLTNLGRLGSPLIRYRTGDVVQLSREHCACGRHFARAEGGIVGRVDDMLIVKGNNVFPSAVEAIVREFSEISEFRLRVSSRHGLNELHIDIEPASVVEERQSLRLAERVAARIRDRLHFRPEVSVVAAGTLPRFEMKARRIVRDQAPWKGQPS